MIRPLCRSRNETFSGNFPYHRSRQIIAESLVGSHPHEKKSFKGDDRQPQKPPDPGYLFQNIGQSDRGISESRLVEAAWISPLTRHPKPGQPFPKASSTRKPVSHQKVGRRCQPGKPRTSQEKSGMLKGEGHQIVDEFCEKPVK